MQYLKPTNRISLFVKLIIVLNLIVTINLIHFQKAKADYLTNTNNNESVRSSPFRKGLATVMFAGLGGAVLGLSTLSFYGDPQEHIGNIWLGLGVGIFAGAGYVFVQNTQSEAYAFHNQFKTDLMLTQHNAKPNLQIPIFQWSTEF